MEHVDLFAGIGGFHRAADALGFRTTMAVEWNPFSQQAYAANYGLTPIGDITKLDVNDIPAHNLLTAGFPCQPFSSAGRADAVAAGRPTGFDHPTQGTLFFDIIRVLRAKRPSYVMLENVVGLMSHDEGRTFKIIVASLEECGYSVSHSIINANAWVPQNRRRIFIFATLDDTVKGFQDYVQPVPTARPVLGDICDFTGSPEMMAYMLSETRYKFAQRRDTATEGFRAKLKILGPTDVSSTLLATYYKDTTKILLEYVPRPRALSPRECARLMGFDDDFLIVTSKTQAYKQFGNALVPAAAADALKHCLAAR